MYDIIIIGAGPAGLTAAVYGKRAGLSVLVLEKLSCGGQIINSPQVENYPAIEHISGWDLAESLEKQAKAVGAEIRMTEVRGLEIHDGIKRVITGKTVFDGKTVIIANGVEHRKLDCPGFEELSGCGISYCASCDGAFYRNKETIIVGGGNTAFEDALYLASICKKVTLVHRRSAFRAETALVDSVKAKDNITIMTPYVPVEILGNKNDGVTGMALMNVETHEQTEVSASGVFVAVGMMPDNDAFAGAVELDSNGYIVAGEDCLTKTTGVFAAGDTRTKLLRQLVTAASDGAMAATQAAHLISSGTWKE